MGTAEQNTLPPVRHSVVLANYNGVDYLGEAIRSVLAQEGVTVELILVDDGSTDGSLALMESMALQHPGAVRVLRHAANRGQGAGFNTGIAAARGAFISFLDSDDVWFPGKLRHVEEAFAKRPDAVMHHHNLQVLRDGVLEPTCIVDMMAYGDLAPRWRQTRSSPEFLPRFAPTSGLTLPRWVLDRIGPCPEIRVCADMWLTFAPLAFGPVSAAYEPFGAYRVHGANNYYGRKMDIWGLLLNELGPPMRAMWARQGVADVLPPPPKVRKVPPPPTWKARVLDLSLRQLLNGLRRRMPPGKG